jgi:His/Glu/Gln/Arg/opine family amino acid ABC transporter permease subunit
MIGGILIGTPLAMMRLSNNFVARNFAKFYVDVFRGIPLIQVIFIFYFLLPKYLPSNQIPTGAHFFQCGNVCDF